MSELFYWRLSERKGMRLVAGRVGLLENRPAWVVCSLSIVEMSEKAFLCTRAMGNHKLKEWML